MNPGGRLCESGVTALLVMAVFSPAGATAQTLLGRVLDEEKNAPIADAVISLVDRNGMQRAGTTSDSLGRFVLAPPRAGEYTVEAARFGYQATRSPLFTMVPDGSVTFEITMRAAPIGLEGFEVSVERRAEEFLGNLGHTPATLGNRWIDRKDIDKMPLPLGPREIIRWRSIPGMWVDDNGRAPGTMGLCVTFTRGRAFSGSRCALVLLNGARVSPVDVDGLGPDEIEAIAILTPTDATTFYGTDAGGGVVLIWTRSGRH